MSARKIAEGIYSVGVADKDVRIFHGYKTPYGSTYNAYLIVSDKIALIDNVKAKFTDEFIANISEIVPLEKIDYIITNHVEPDHSGSIVEVSKLAKNAQIYATVAGIRGLNGYYPTLDKERFVPVKAGDSLNIGEFTFDFVPMPMVHWPDSMCTYIRENGMLFSNDAFGQHYGSDFLFDDEVESDFFFDVVENYYGNIVLPFGAQVAKVLDGVAGLDVKMILPSHGLIVRTQIAEIVAKYAEYAKNVVVENRAVIVYDSMWGATEIMANNLKAEWEAEGKEVFIYNLSEDHYSHVMGKVTQAKYIAVGASTLNREVMPTVSAFLCYMKGLSPKGRVGLAFGSYGWSGESVKIANDVMAGLGWEMMEPRKVMWKTGL